MRHAMGVAVFSGMLGVTFFGLLLTPVFFVLIRRYVERAQARKAARAEHTRALAMDAVPMEKH
jgi:multidrug efflux pump